MRRVPFLERIVDEKKEKFLWFELDVNPLDMKGVDKRIRLKTNSVKVVFNPIMLVRLKQVFDLKVSDENLKNAAWDSVEAA